MGPSNAQKVWCTFSDDFEKKKGCEVTLVNIVFKAITETITIVY